MTGRTKRFRRMLRRHFPHLRAHRTYQCEACGGTFFRGWSDEEGQREASSKFGINDVHDPTVAIICDDCFSAMETVWSMQPAEVFRALGLEPPTWN